MLCTCVRYLCLLRKLEGVHAVGEVGGECVVQLTQRLLQYLQRLLVLLQSLQLLLKADLSVHRLEGGGGKQTFNYGFDFFKLKDVECAHPSKAKILFLYFFLK